MTLPDDVDQGATASVPFPPPLANFTGLLVGFALHFTIPLHIVSSPRAARLLDVVGSSLLVITALLAVSALKLFRLANTTPTFRVPSRALIVRGPFRVSRNPVYLAAAFFHAGLALLANALWPLILLVPALLVVNHLISREESYLTRRFGSEYEAYCQSVRRWL